MTDISVHSAGFQSENRSWLLGPDGVRSGDTPSLSLDVSTFDAEDHYPNGYIPSGIVLGKITSSGKYGPYDPDGSDGREVASELLFSSIPVPTGATVLGGAGVHKGEVDPDKLPISDGEGALDATARIQLRGIFFSDAPTPVVVPVEIAAVPAEFADLAAARTYVNTLVDVLVDAGLITIGE